MRVVIGFVSGLTGLLSCWLTFTLAGAAAPIWDTGKNIFALYFSLFAFAILFAPVYLFGRKLIFKFGRVFRYCSQDVAYCFLLGLAINPALMIGELIVNTIGSDGAFENNAMRLFFLMTIAAPIDFLFCATGFLILLRVFRRSPSASSAPE